MTERDSPLPVSEHLAELRRRLIISLVSIAVCVGISFLFAPDLFEVLTAPALEVLPPDTRFVALSPFEGWLAYMKIALAAGLAMSSPVWIGQILVFASPAINRRALHITVAFGFASAFLFVAGVVFCYAMIVPAAISFGFGLIENMDVTLIPQMDRYISLILMLLLAFGLSFQLPFAMAGIMLLRIADISQLRRIRPYAYVGAFIVGALLTPPDVLTQIALAIPLILLFEFGLLLGRLMRC